jgi:hypothetical protein
MSRWSGRGTPSALTLSSKAITVAYASIRCALRKKSCAHFRDEIDLSGDTERGDGFWQLAYQQVRFRAHAKEVDWGEVHKLDWQNKDVNSKWTGRRHCR